MVFSTVNFIYISLALPFKQKMKNIFELVNEGTILSCSHITILMLNDSYSESRSALGWILIALFTLNLITNFAVALFIGGKNLYLHVSNNKLQKNILLRLLDKVRNRVSIVKFAPDAFPTFK